MASQLHGNNYWHSHDQACFQVERSDFGQKIVLPLHISCTGMFRVEHKKLQVQN